MEKKESLNSCLMLTANLDAPVSLCSVFDSEDLKDTGVELDSHITITYAQGKVIPKEELLPSIQMLLGLEWEGFRKELESNEAVSVLDLFDLGSFENDSDYVVLLLKPDVIIRKNLTLLNKGIGIKYDISSEFKDYTPHLTLAELQPGSAKKYMKSEILMNILQDSTISFEDLVISYGTDNEVEDRKQIFLTQNHCVERYFRLENLKKEAKELQD